jgi:quercetin dioxygenase-like cupin family protein
VKLEVIRWTEGAPPTAAALKKRLAAEGFEAFEWSDAPGAHYEAHSHDHDESIWVVEGEIAFGAGGGRHRLQAGDRLMLPGGTVHTADAGEAGARYLIGERR